MNVDTDLKRDIVATVTLHSDRVGGGAPIFLARDQRELEAIAAAIARVVIGMVHAVGEGTFIIVKH